MTGNALYDGTLIALFALAPISFGTLMWWRAPYGRYSNPRAGLSLPARSGWILMEAPAVFAMLFFFLRGANAGNPAPLVLLLMWQAHYLHRALIYPLRMRLGPKSRMPLSVVGPSFAYQSANGYLNGSWVGHYGAYPTAWLSDPRFIAGFLLFLAGFAINRWADAVLRHLRRPGESGYKIPHGGLYEWISCPNYFGELLTWSGWALASSSPAGLAFALVTAANLIPRAIMHHRWYRREFSDYPVKRRAVLPGLL